MRYLHINKDLSKWFGNDQLWYDTHNQRYAWFQIDPNYCEDPQKIFIFDGYNNIAEATYGVLKEAR